MTESDTNTTDTQAVVIERTLAAPIETVWTMWADADGFASWYGPEGATIPSCTHDLTVGGRRHVCMEMQTPNGSMQMWFVGEFLEIDEPTRLVYTEAMSNEAGDALSPEEMGMPPGMPASTTVTVELRAVDGGTHMVMIHAGVPADSPGAQGWAMAIDKLVARLDVV